MLVTAEEIRVVAVLGAGTMGHGIAQVAAQAGFEVRLCDVERSLVDRGLARIRENLDGGVARGKVAPEHRDQTLARLSATTLVAEAGAGADLVIEAIPEDLELKRRTFALLDQCCAPRTLLVTNTSSLSVSKVAHATSRPERVVGMHFFNPVHLMKLVEVVRHDHASEAAVRCAVALGQKLGKEPIVVKDVAGFASSRLGIALGLEAIRMVEEGVAAAADIDKAMKLGYGHPMGPLELTDHVGLDVRLAIAEYLEQELGPAFHPPDLLVRKVAEGKLGKKSGEGFYPWNVPNNNK
jgi:3-hydroxybutyryl-CoA dehydrogenase